MRNMEVIKKALSILLAFCMVLSCVPTTACAVPEDNLCEHHEVHTAEVCGYVKGEVDCTYHCHICHVQELVDALPESVTADNSEAVAAQLTAIDTEKASLSDEEMTQVDFAKYTAAAEALGSVYDATPADTGYYAGGIVGSQEGAEITNASNSGTVTGGDTTGDITEAIQIFIKKPDGTTLTLEVAPDATVNSLKETIQEKYGYPTANQTLIYNGRQLIDGSKTLTDYSITSKATIQLIVRWNVAIAGTTNGTVTADKATAAEGATVTLTIAPNEGYELDALTVTYGDDKTAVIVAEDNTFTMPAGDVTVTAIFKAEAAEPVETNTIYFDNSVALWSTVYAYAWESETGTSCLGTWPGTAMTPVEGEAAIYSVSVLAGANTIIFNNGSAQTGDQPLSTGNCFKAEDTNAEGQYIGSWYTYPCTHADGNYTDNLDGTHSGTCTACGSILAESEAHTLDGNGECTTCGGAFWTITVNVDPDRAYTCIVPAGQDATVNELYVEEGYVLDGVEVYYSSTYAPVTGFRCGHETVTIPGEYVTADLTILVSVRTIDIDAHRDHVYSGAPTFTWAEDYSAATATWVCLYDGNENNIICTVASQTQDATCKADGKTTYTATATLDGADYIDTQTVSISKDTVNHTPDENGKCSVCDYQYAASVTYESFNPITQESAKVTEYHATFAEAATQLNEATMAEFTLTVLSDAAIEDYSFDSYETIVINEGVTLTNNGTLTIGGTLTNNGTIVNNGTIFLPAAYTWPNENITGGTVTIGAKSYTWDSEQNKYICDDVFHTGGTATCQKKAVCETCGSEYGDLAAHTMAYFADEDADTITYQCSVCGGEAVTFTLVIPTDGTYGDSAMEVPHFDCSDTSYNGEFPKVTIDGRENYYPTVTGTYAVVMTWGGKTVSGEYTISKANPEIGTVGCDAVLYDSTAITSVVLTRTDTSVEGNLVLTDSELTAGEKEYHWKFTPTDTDNYNTITGTVTLNVTADVPEKIETSGALTKNSYTYGDTFSIDGLTVTAVYTSGATKDVTELVTFNSTLAVGQTSVELSYGGKTCEISGITVDKKQLDVSHMTWTVPTGAVYSGTAYTATLSGDLPEGVKVTVSGNTGIKAGSYTATAKFSLADGYSADNYEIVNGEDLTTGWSIAKKDIADATITLGAGLTYNGGEQTQTVTSVEIDGLTVTYGISGNTGTNAGDYELTVTGSGNFEGTATKTWSIAKKSVTVSAKDQTITYGETISGTEVTSTGLVDGHSVTVTLTPSTANVTVNSTITPSAAVITADGSDVTANYSVSYDSGKLVIDPDTSKIDALTTENVTSANEEDIKAVQAMMASAEMGGIDEATAAEWAAITANCEDLIEKIEAIEAENARIADAAADFDLNTVKSTDEAAITALIADIDDQLATGNLTDKERSELEGLKTKCNNLIAKIDGTETLIGQLDKTVDDLDAETVKSTDKAALEQVIADAQTLIDSDNVTEAEKESLKQTQEDAQALIKVIDDTAAENKAVTDQAAAFDEETVKSTDKTELEQLAQDIEDLLETQNLTEDERTALETVLEQVESMIDTINETAEDSKGATDTIGALEAGSVTSDDKDELEQAIATIDELLQADHLTEEERTVLEDAKADAEALIDVIESVQDATDTENTEKVEDVTAENVKPEDKEALEDAKADLEKALEDNSGNYTEEEKQAIQDEIQRIEDAIEALENVEDVTETITQLPESVEPDDEEAAEKILDAKKTYDELTDHEKSLVDETTKEKLDGLVADLTGYDIIKGDGGKWTKGSSYGLSFTANGPFSKFVGIEVDGKEVASTYYTAESGSTIITLKQSFLKRLSTGEHTITVLYTDGETSGTFKILAQSTSPATSDDSNIMLWSGMLCVSTLGLVLLLVDLKRRRSTK